MSFEREQHWRVSLEKRHVEDGDHFEQVLRVRAPDGRKWSSILVSPLTAETIVSGLRQLADLVERESIDPDKFPEFRRPEGSE